MPFGRLLPSPRSHARAHVRDEGGQAVIIVGLSLVVLLAALALGAEWGYGVTQRRVMQNAADAGGLAGAKLLATNVTSIPGGIGFRVHKEDVYCTALAVVQANHSFQPGNETQVIAVAGSVDKTTWTAFPAPAGACPPPGNLVVSNNQVDPATVFVRVQSNITYRGLFGA